MEISPIGTRWMKNQKNDRIKKVIMREIPVLINLLLFRLQRNRIQ